MQIMRISNFIMDSIILSGLPKSLFAIVVFVLSLAATCGNVCAQGGDGTVIHYLPPLWPYHAFLVSMGLIFIIGGMLAARYRKGRKKWLKTHKTLGLLGVALAIAGVIMAVYMVSTYLGIYFIKITHAYVGIASLLLVVLAPLTLQKYTSEDCIDLNFSPGNIS
jgi:peptidoglycan/LPS O-acetylase OafA/YrhL